MKTQQKLFINWYRKNLSKRFSNSEQERKRLSKKLIDILVCEPINIENIGDYFMEDLTSKYKNGSEENEKIYYLVEIEVKKHISSLAKEGSIKISQIYDLYFGQARGYDGESDNKYLGPTPLELNSLNSHSKLTEICGYISKDLRRLFPDSLGFWYKTDEELKNENYVDLNEENLSTFSHSFLNLPKIVTINDAYLNPQLFFKYLKEKEMQKKMRITKPAISPKHLRFLFDQANNISDAILHSYKNLKFLLDE